MPAGDSSQNKAGAAASGRALLLKPATAEKLLALLERIDLEPDPVQFDRFTRAGKTFFRYRPGTAGDSPPGGAGDPAPLTATIVRLPDTDPAEYGVTVTPGFVLYQNAGASESTQGVTGFIVPTSGGTELDATPAPAPLALPALASWIYLRLRTDSRGVPKFDLEGGCATIEAFTSAQQSTHHIPPSPSGEEEDGNYYFLLLQTQSDGGDPAVPVIQKRITGNREQPNQLIEIENIGGKRPLYKGYTPGPDDKHEIRSLEQLVTENAADIIKPLGESEEEGSTIQFRNIRKDNDSTVPYSITASGNSVNFQLSGSNSTYNDLDGGSITHAGGLAREILLSDLVPESFDIEIWGKNFTIDFTAETVNSEDGTSATASLFVRKGRVYRSNPDAEPADPPLPVFKIYESSVST